MRRRRNPDTRLREAERACNVVGFLHERRRAGELTRARLELAAALGHSAARALAPDVALVDWADRKAKRTTVLLARDLVGDFALARVAADWAEKVLHAFECSHPNDNRPRNAVLAARALASLSAEALAGLSPQAKRDAVASVDHAGLNASVAAGVSPDGAHFAAGANPAADAADAVTCACLVASAAVVGHAWFSDFVVVTSSAATCAASDSERDWQRLRLAAYVLGEASWRTSLPKRWAYARADRAIRRLS